MANAERGIQVPEKEATARIKINKLLVVKLFLRSGNARRVLFLVDRLELEDQATNPVFSTSDYRAVPEPFRALVPEYVKDYVSLNQFAT